MRALCNCCYAEDNVKVQGMGVFFFGYAPGPDLAWQVAVIESDPCISSENSYISKSRRARAGL